MEKVDVSKFKGKNIMAIGAHPDDLEFACGGTLMRLAENNRITVVLVTSGQMGSHDENTAKSEVISVREAEQREASQDYGAQKVLFLKFADMSVNEDTKRLRKRLIKLFLRTRPQILITHDPWAEYFPYHPDHRAIGFAVYDAVIAATLPLYIRKKSVSGKTLTNRPEIWFMHPHEPTHGVDISDVYKQKIQSIKKHKSQFDNKLEWERIQNMLNTYFLRTGRELKVNFAEPFRIINH